MDLSILNENQYKAVTYGDGPLMVMAGAGSGKTRVLTYRVAYLIEELGISPMNILAVTFTNKAAAEMKERISVLLGMDVSKMWISTFHSFCARFLRKEIRFLKRGFSPSFIIIDDDDEIKILKELIKDLELTLSHKEAYMYISDLKNETALPSSVDEITRTEIDKLFMAYEKRLEKENLLDFDDLLRYTVQILEENIPVREKYNLIFNYVLIDEFQDTNLVQLKLINLLCQETKNVFVVGDINQSIYSFRGARIQNIRDFERKYKPELIKLEENYRSTETILNVANEVISKNSSNHGMKLYTNIGSGEKVNYQISDSGYGECLFVTEEIKRLHRQGYDYKDIAVLYRLNSLSLGFENEFIKAKIPYVVYGGVGYYERKEVKDIIAYLRLILNKNDDFSFKRIVNVPKRKIGAKQIEKLQDLSDKQGVSLFQAIDNSGNSLLLSFKELINDLSLTFDTMYLDKFLDLLFDKTGYLQMLKDEEEDDRIDNILELKSIMKELMESYDGTNREKLENFLLDLSLRTDVDNISEGDDKVKLMNFHQAKGLEYRTVFMVSLEQGIFPAFKSMDSMAEMEEERRICYVGITRAKEKLYLCYAKQRRLYGNDNAGYPSEFLKDISNDYLNYMGVHAPQLNTPKSNKISPSGVSNKNDGTIKPGDKIMHKVFGKGVVVSRDGNKITVAFGIDFGIKILAADHPSITKL